jgi:hypothetical protein
MEKIGANINDKSLSLPGGQQWILMDGHQIPMEFHNPLITREFTNQIMTSYIIWSPSLLFDNMVGNIDHFNNLNQNAVHHSQ